MHSDALCSASHPVDFISEIRLFHLRQPLLESVFSQSLGSPACLLPFSWFITKKQLLRAALKKPLKNTKKKFWERPLCRAPAEAISISRGCASSSCFMKLGAFSQSKKKKGQSLEVFRGGNLFCFALYWLWSQFTEQNSQTNGKFCFIAC